MVLWKKMTDQWGNLGDENKVERKKLMRLRVFG